MFVYKIIMLCLYTYICKDKLHKQNKFRIIKYFFANETVVFRNLAHLCNKVLFIQPASPSVYKM